MLQMLNIFDNYWVDRYLLKQEAWEILLTCNEYDSSLIVLFIIKSFTVQIFKPISGSHQNVRAQSRPVPSIGLTEAGIQNVDLVTAFQH